MSEIKCRMCSTIGKKPRRRFVVDGICEDCVNRFINRARCRANFDRKQDDPANYLTEAKFVRYVAGYLRLLALRRKHGMTLDPCNTRGCKHWPRNGHATCQECHETATRVLLLAKEDICIAKLKRDMARKLADDLCRFKIVTDEAKTRLRHDQQFAEQKLQEAKLVFRNTAEQFRRVGKVRSNFRL